jgi:hypothetical protein
MRSKELNRDELVIRVPWLAGFVLTCLLAAAPMTASAQPAVTVLDLSGNIVSGRLVQMDLPAGMHLDVAGKPVVVPGAQLIWIGFDRQPRADVKIEQWFAEPPPPSRKKPEPIVPIRVTLRDMQVLHGTLREPAGPDTLSLEHRLLGDLDLPLAQAKEIRIQPASAGFSPGRPLAKAAPTSFDVLWLSNGDRVEGILHSLGRDQSAIELASGQPARMPTASVRIVRLAAVPAPTTAPASQPAASASLRFRNSERIIASKIAWDTGQAVMKFEFRGQTFTVSISELAGIEPITNKRQWLSDLQPVHYEHQPRLAPSLSWQADATTRGAPIYCNDQPVLRGLGMPSGSTIRYDLNRTYTKLTVWPILDDSADPNVSCKARILIDGQPAWHGEVKALTPPRSVTINLAGKRELTLQVEPAADDKRSRFVWAWPVMAK